MNKQRSLPATVSALHTTVCLIRGPSKWRGSSNPHVHTEGQLNSPDSTDIVRSTGWSHLSPHNRSWWPRAPYSSREGGDDHVLNVMLRESDPDWEVAEHDGKMLNGFPQ